MKKNSIYSSIVLTTGLLFIIETSQVSAQQSFGGIQFSGVGAAVLGCSGVTDRIAEAMAKLQQSALAAGSTSVVGIQAGLITQTNDQIQQLKTESLKKKENCLDPIAYSLGTNVVNSFVDGTLNWATTGFNGTPFFIRNQGSFFENITRDAKQTFLAGVPTTNDVYGNAVRYAIIAQETGRRASRSALRGNNDAATQEINDFTQDFKQGGWNTFFNTTQFTSRNPVASLFVVTEEQARQREALIEEKTNELMRSGGFLDQKKCVEWGLGGQEGTTVRNPITGEESRIEPNCLREEVVTPGKVIAEQTVKATQAAQERASQADEVNEVLGGFIDRLISNLANRGLAALTRPRTRVVQTGPNITTEQQTIEDFRGSFDQNNFSITNPRHIQALIKAQKDYLSIIQDSRIASEESLASLGELDYCVPGPNEPMISLANNNMMNIRDGLQNGNVRRRFLSSARYRQLQPVPFFVDNPVAEGTFVLNNPIYINTTVDDEEEQGIFVDNVQNKSIYYFDIFKDLFSREKIIAFFENTQSTQQERDTVRGSIQSALLETKKLSEYSKSVKTLLATYDQTTEVMTENIAELESIHRQILGIVRIARERHIAEQRAQGVSVNLECLDIQYSVNDPIIVGRVRRESDTLSEKVKTLRESEAYFFSPQNLYRDHNLPFQHNY